MRKPFLLSALSFRKREMRDSGGCIHDLRLCVQIGYDVMYMYARPQGKMRGE